MAPSRWTGSAPGARRILAMPATAPGAEVRYKNTPRRNPLIEMNNQTSSARLRYKKSPALKSLFSQDLSPI